MILMRLVVRISALGRKYSTQPMSWILPSFDAPLNLQPYAIWRYANQHIRAVWYLTIAL